jgi:hypothetical protein
MCLIIFRCHAEVIENKNFFIHLAMCNKNLFPHLISFFRDKYGIERSSRIDKGRSCDSPRTSGLNRR